MTEAVVLFQVWGGCSHCLRVQQTPKPSAISCQENSKKSSACGKVTKAPLTHLIYSSPSFCCGTNISWGYTDANNKKLPSRLVGRKCTSRIAVNGEDCSCLLDTGSQVTTISMTFYQDHLSNHPISPTSDLLEVEGTNGGSWGVRPT